MSRSRTEEKLKKEQERIISHLQYFNILDTKLFEKIRSDKNPNSSKYLDDKLMPLSKNIYEKAVTYFMGGNSEMYKLHAYLRLCFIGALSQKAWDKIWNEMSESDKIFYATTDNYGSGPVVIAARSGNIEGLKKLNKIYDAILLPNSERRYNLHNHLWQIMKHGVTNIDSQAKLDCYNYVLEMCEKQSTLVDKTQKDSFSNRKFDNNIKGLFSAKEDTLLLDVFAKIAATYFERHQSRNKYKHERNMYLIALNNLAHFVYSKTTKEEFKLFKNKIKELIGESGSKDIYKPCWGELESPHYDKIYYAATKKNITALNEVRSVLDTIDVKHHFKESILELTPVLQLASENNTQAVDFLLTNGASVYEAITGYARANNIKKVNELIELTRDINLISAKKAALAGYASRGNSEQLRIIIKDLEKDLNNDELSDLYQIAFIRLASIQNTEEIAFLMKQLIYKMGSDESAFVAGIMAAINANAMFGNEEEVNRLLEELITLQKDDSDIALINSLRAGIISIYINTGYHHLADKLKFKCIYDAALHQNKIALNEILKNSEYSFNADIHATNDDMLSPVALLALEGKKDAVDFLLSHGAKQHDADRGYRLANKNAENEMAQEELNVGTNNAPANKDQPVDKNLENETTKIAKKENTSDIIEPIVNDMQNNDRQTIDKSFTREINKNDEKERIQNESHAVVNDEQNGKNPKIETSRKNEEEKKPEIIETVVNDTSTNKDRDFDKNLEIEITKKIEEEKAPETIKPIVNTMQNNKDQPVDDGKKNNENQPVILESKLAMDKLYQSISAMDKYGDELINIKRAPEAGKTAKTLASDLKKMVDTYLSDNKITFNEFKTKFSAKLDDKDVKDQMSHYRVAWKTIVANIVIALSGVGALAIAGMLIYSKVKHDRALFFFQDTKTTREKKHDDIKSEFDKLKPKS